LDFDSANIYYLAEHISFIRDLIRDWVNYPGSSPATLKNWSPSTYAYNFKFTNSTILLNINDMNVIEKHNDLNENIYFCIATPDMSIKFVSPSDMYKPEFTQYQFDVNVAGSPYIFMQYPEKHPLRRSVPDENPHQFLSGESLRVYGTYLIHTNVAVDVTDCVEINVEANNIILMMTGYYLSFIINMWYNYFTSQKLWINRKEFEVNGFKNEKSPQISRLQYTSINGYTTPHNKCEYFVTIKLNRGKVLLPLNLYTVQDRAVTIIAQQFHMDIRYCDEYLDLCFGLSPLKAEIPEYVPSDKISSQKSRSTFIGTDGMQFSGQIMVGAPPDGSFYKYGFNFDIGNITGELNPSQLASLVAFGTNFMYQWSIAFPEDSLLSQTPEYKWRDSRYQHSDISKYRPTVVNVGIKSVNGIIYTNNGNIHATIDQGIHFSYDSTADQKSNDRLKLEIPHVSLKFLSRGELNMIDDGDYVEVGNISTGITLSMINRNPDVAQYYFDQQEFIKYQRSHCAHWELDTDKLLFANTGNNSNNNTSNDNTSQTTAPINMQTDQARQQARKSREKIHTRTPSDSNSSNVVSSTGNDTDSNTFYDVDDEQQSEEETQYYTSDEEQDEAIPKKQTQETRASTSPTATSTKKYAGGKQISQNYISELITTVAAISSNDEDEDEEIADSNSGITRGDTFIIFKRAKSSSLNMYSKHLCAYDLQVEQNSQSLLDHAARSFLSESGPERFIGTYSPFPDIHAKMRVGNFVQGRHMKTFGNCLTSFDIHSFAQMSNQQSQKEREHIEKLMRIDQLAEEQRTNLKHINLSFSQNVEVLISPNMLQIVEQIIKSLLTHPENLNDTMDRIEKRNAIFAHKPAPPIPFEWEFSKIIFSCSLNAINIHAIQALSPPAVIPSPLLGKTCTYSLKATARKLFVAFSVCHKNVDCKQELYSVQATARLKSIFAAMQCLDRTTKSCKGIPINKLNSTLRQACNLDPDKPIILSAELEEFQLEGKYETKDINFQGRFNCNLSKQVELHTVHEIPVIGFSMIEPWKHPVDQIMETVEIAGRTEIMYEMVLLSGVSHFCTKAVNLEIPDHKIAILELRSKVTTLSTDERTMIRKRFETTNLRVFSKKDESKLVNLRFVSLIYDPQSASPYSDSGITAKIKGIRESFKDFKNRADIRFRINGITLSVYTQDYEKAIITRSLAKVGSVEVKGRVELQQYFKRASSVHRSSTGRFSPDATNDLNGKRIREVTLFVSASVKDISFDIHPSTLLIVTASYGAYLKSLQKNKSTSGVTSPTTASKKQPKAQRVHTRPKTFTAFTQEVIASQPAAKKIGLLNISTTVMPRRLSYEDLKETDQQQQTVPPKQQQQQRQSSNARSSWKENNNVTNLIFIFVNIHVTSITARAWMDRHNFAELEADTISLSFNQPKNSESVSMSIRSQMYESMFKTSQKPSSPQDSNNKTKDINLKLSHSTSMSIKKIEFQYNYSSAEDSNKRTDSVHFVSLFDATLRDLRVNEFWFKANERDNCHIVCNFDGLLVNFPYTDVWSAASMQFRNFVQAWVDAITLKPTVTKTRATSIRERSKSATDASVPTSPLSQYSPTKEINMNRYSTQETSAIVVKYGPIINVVIDAKQMVAHFMISPTLQMRVSMTRIVASYNLIDTGNSSSSSSFRVHTYPCSLALKTNLNEEFPTSHSWQAPTNETGFSSEPKAKDFKKQFLLPQVYISGQIEKFIDENTKNITRRVSTQISVEYIENVVTSELLNHVLYLQSAFTKEINTIMKSFAQNVRKQDLEKIKTELPKAQASVTSLNLEYSIDLLLEGVHLTALGASTAVCFDSGTAQMKLKNFSKSDPASKDIRWSITLKDTNLEMVDTFGLVFSNKREFNDKYSSTQKCYKWASFTTNVRVQNFAKKAVTDNTPATINNNESDEDATTKEINRKNFLVEVKDTHVYARSGCIDQGAFLYKDYKEAVNNLFKQLKQNREHLKKNDAIASLVKRGEEYYSYYSKQIVEKVTAVDPGVFISSGIVNIMNTTLTLPVGDNAYYGFLAHTKPTFVPSTALHFLVKSIQLSALTQSGDELTSDTDTTTNINTTDNDEISSKQVGICKIETVCLYYEEIQHNKKKLLYIPRPELDKFSTAQSKCKVDKCVASLQFRTSKRLMRGIFDLNVTGPQVRATPALVRDALNLGYDWFNPRRKLYTDPLQFSNKTQQQVAQPKQPAPSTKPSIIRRIHITCKIKIEEGECKLYHTLNHLNSESFFKKLRMKRNNDPKISVQCILPSLSADLVHMSPAVTHGRTSSSNRSNTHLHISVLWSGAKLAPHSVFFFREAYASYIEWSKIYTSGIKKRQKTDQKDLEYDPNSNILKPLTWMRLMRAVILVQRVYRGYKVRKLVRDMKKQQKQPTTPLSARSNMKNSTSTTSSSSTSTSSSSSSSSSRQTDTFSFLCRIEPFKVELTCDPVTDIITHFEFTKPFDLLFTRSFRSVKTQTSKGNAIYNCLFVSLPEVNVRCYHLLSPPDFASLKILGIKGNLGSGYGSFLRPDMASVQCATMNINSVQIVGNLPQLNVFFIVYTTWMSKVEEANKALSRHYSKGSNSDELSLETPATTTTPRMKAKRKTPTEEITFDATSSRFGQLLLNTVEIYTDLGPSIGKQEVTLSSSCISIRDLGRYEGSVTREPMYIGGYLGQVSAILRDRLEGKLKFDGATLGLTRHFRTGGERPILRGRTEASLKILPVSINLEYNKHKILHISLRMLVGKFRDVFDGKKDGSTYHVQTVFTSEGIKVKVSKQTAASFIKLGHRVADQISKQKEIALETLNNHQQYHNNQSMMDLPYEERFEKIKSVNIKNPTKQLMSTSAMGTMSLIGKDLLISLYDRDYHDLTPDDEWIEFAMNNYKVELGRGSNVKDNITPQIQRKLSILLNQVDVNRMTGVDKRALILQVPRGASIDLRTVQEVDSNIIKYLFDSKFADAINVTTNINLYQSIRTIISIYQQEVELENQSYTTLTSSSSSVISSRTPTSPENVTPVQQELIFEGKVELNPKLNVLGDLTPKVETVLGWLGITDKNVIPRAMHNAVATPLETVFVTCFEASNLIDRVLEE
jgi:hypothetical protein